jgi:hypothetical protein
MEVAKAIAQALKDAKYDKVDKDELKKLVYGANPLTDKDFKSADKKQLVSELKDRGYNPTESAFIVENGFDGIKKVEDARRLNKQLGTSEKQKAVKLTVNEKSALKDQIKLKVAENKATLKSVSEFTKDIAKIVSDTLKEHKTTISTKQLNAIQKRASMLKIGSPKSVDKYIDYVDKVISNAEYADQLSEVKSTAKKIKKLIKNDKIPATVRATANDFISLDASDVRNLNKHQIIMNELYDAMKSGGIKVQQGEIVDKTRKAVDLDRINEYIADETKLAYKRMQESMAEEYNETTENLESEDPIDATDMIKEYVKNKFATLSRMVQSMIINGTSPLDGEGYDFSKEELSMIKKATAIKLDNFDNVKDWYEATEALDHLLTNGDLGRIPNILNRYEISSNAKKGLEVLKSKTSNPIKFLRITKALADLNAFITKPFALEQKDSYGKKVYFSKNDLRRIDNLVSNFTDNDIYENTFYQLARAYATEKAFVREMDAQKIEGELFRENGYDQDKFIESIYKITAYMRQLEYESNPISDKNLPAIDYLNATVKASKDLEHPIQEQSRLLLEKVIAESSTDGQIDLNKLEKNLSNADKTAIKKLQESYKKLFPYHNKVSVDIRNKPFIARDNYTHISAITGKEMGLSAIEAKQKYNQMLGGTKSGTIEERGKTATPIDMNPFSTFNHALQNVSLDYFMTTPFRTVEKVLNSFTKYTVEELGGTIRGTDKYKQALRKKDVAEAWKDIFEDVKKTMLDRSYYEHSFAKDMVQLVTKRSVQYILARPHRLISELSSNIGMVGATGPKEFALGIQAKGFDNYKVMQNLQSSATERLYPHGGLGSSMMDAHDYDISVASNQNTINRARNKGLQAYYKYPAKIVRVGEYVSDKLISSGDLLIGRNVWKGAMESEFKKLTGEKIDFEKIANNDIEYMDRYISSLDKARTYADRRVTDVASSKNIFEIAPSMSTKRLPFYTSLKNYMRGFQSTEAQSLQDAIIHLQKGGKVSRQQALQNIIGIGLRAGVYRASQAAALTAITAGIYMVNNLFKGKPNSDDEKLISKWLEDEGMENTPENKAKLLLNYFNTQNPKIKELEGMKVSDYIGEALKTSDDEWVKMMEKIQDKPNMWDNFLHGALSGYIGLLTQRTLGNLSYGLGVAPVVEYTNQKIREKMGLGYDRYQDSFTYNKIPSTEYKDWWINAIRANMGAYGEPIAQVAEMLQSLIVQQDNYKKLEELNTEIADHERGTPVENPSLKAYYALKDRRTALENRIKNTWLKVGKDASVFGLMGVIPALKDIDKGIDQAWKPTNMPDDIKELQERIESLKKNVMPKIDKKTLSPSKVSTLIDKGVAIPETIEESKKMGLGN